MCLLRIICPLFRLLLARLPQRVVAASRATREGDGALTSGAGSVVVCCAAYKSIVQGDRIVTEPDDVLKIEEKVRQLHKERIASIAHEQAHKNRTQSLPGAFRWFQDEAEEEGIDNSTNVTYGTWVWCRNETCVPHPPSRVTHRAPPSACAPLSAPVRASKPSPRHPSHARHRA